MADMEEPAREDPLVTVFEDNRRAAVEMAKLVLREAEVPFVAVNDVISGIYPVDGMALVRLQVHESDAETARFALQRAGLAAEDV